MIDVHCHLLPGIDDGASTLEESLDLARAAVAAGIEIAVMTPHVHPGRYQNDAGSIRKLCAAFQQVLDYKGIPLELRVGGEVRLSEDIPAMVDAGQIPYLGQIDGFRIMLLEFPHSHIVVGAERLVAWLLEQGIRPLIAHPERNKDVMRNVTKLQPFVEMGCLLQLTGASVVGKFGRPAQACALDLLGREWVAAVATDAHNLEHRPPSLDEAHHALVQMGGHAFAHELTTTVPAKLISGSASVRSAMAVTSEFQQ